MLVLASRSPQRKRILEQLGIEFQVEPADVEEVTEGDPREVVVENALRKARAVEGDLVLGADTEVFLDGRVFGKADSEEEAADHLRALSGRTHEVWGGIALREGDDIQTAHAVTRVSFRPLERARPGLVPRERRVARAGGGVRDPGARGGAGRLDRGRLLECGRPAGARAARTGSWTAYPIAGTVEIGLA